MNLESDRKSTADADKGRDARGRFAEGNAGRKPGARNRATALAEKLLTADVEDIAKSVIDRAKGGDMTAAKLILNRISPPRRDRPIEVDIPEIQTAADAVKALGKIATAMGAGELTPSEAQAAGAVLTTFCRAVEVAELEQRLEAIERTLK